MRASGPAVAVRIGVVGVVIVAGMMFSGGGGVARGAVIGASFNEAMPSAPPTSYAVIGGGGGGQPTNIIEDVALDLAAGPWLKDLVNQSGSGILSGQRRQIIETLTNAGTLTWAGWHERVLTRTSIFAENDSPGFLFRSDSLTLSANYGSGFVPLTHGVDYTVTPTPNSGPPGGGNGPHWEGITIELAPHAVIDPGDALRIDKEIFEVSGDANIWVQGEAARIGQYPIGVPEPGGVFGAAVVMVGAIVRRARRRRVQ